MAGGSLLALAEVWAASDDSSSAKALQAALAKAASSRDSREAREAGLKAFKAAQQRLSAAGLSVAAAEQLAALGQAALAALAAGGSGTPAQLAGWRYNFARRLVSARAYASAHAVAWELLCQLNEQAVEPRKAGAGGAATSAETASMAVGAVLTMVLSCVEGRLLASAEPADGMLVAADSLPRWLSQLGAAEAARHSEAAYKYLYKAGVALLEQQAWPQLAGVCGGLLAAAGGDGAAQRRALAAAAKLVAHMPDEHAAAAVSAVAAKACGKGSSDLGPEAATDLLGMLCSTAQRAASAAAAHTLSEAVLGCNSSTVPALQVAPLLLPALALQHPPARGEPGWLEPVSTAVRLVSASLQQLQVSLPPAAAQQHLAVLQSACQAANVLRRVLATQLAGSDKAATAAAAAPSSHDACDRLGGPAAVNVAASVLELLAGAVGVGSRQPHDGTAAALGSQGHAAAVALVTAARLRAACLLQQAGQGAAGGRGELQHTAAACGLLLGWDLPRFCSACSELPPAACAVQPQELSWLASALFNVGVDLHAAQCYAAAVPALQAALAAAAVGLRAVANGAAQEETTRLSDFCRKCAALSSAQQQAGDLAAALGSLGHSVALLLQLGFAQPAAWLPLVQAFVRLQSDAAHEQTAAVAEVAAAPQPARRGRGAASKKAAASSAAVSVGSAASSQAGDALLAQLLQQHEAGLPTGCITAVLEQELLCWGAALQGSDLTAPSAGSTVCRSVVQRLLQEVFPAAEQPVQHASVLLALYQAGLPADDGQGELPLLERACAALKKMPGKEASGLLARAHCLHAVEAGRQLACQALLEQQQERQRSHAAASTSAVGSREQDAAALGQLAGGTAGHAAAWRRVVQQAEQAVELLPAAGDLRAAPCEFEELAWLLGLHGSDAVAQQLSGLQCGSLQSPAGVLATCLFPAAPASAAELQQQAEEAAAEASRASAELAMRRAALHGQAAEACAAGGDMVPALYHAAEGHRLLAVLFHGGSDSAAGGPATPATASRPGWWRLAAAYLGSLLQLGQLFEAAGQADEALHSLREGQRLAVAAGAAPVAAAFAARMADIYCKQGEVAAAQQAATAAEQQLEAVPGSDSPPLAYCRAAVQLVRAQLGLAAAGGAPGKAVWQACLAAVASCEELSARAASDAAAARGFCAALHAAALLTLAEAARQRDDAAAAWEHAAAALAVTEASGACSAVRCQHAAALLFLGRHAAAEAAAEQHLSIWGLGAGGDGSNAGSDATAAALKSRARKQPGSRGRGKAAAAAAAAEDGGSDRAIAPAMQQERMQRLWQALECSRGLLPAHREAAALLAAECGRLGYLHLAALLLHYSLGAALQLQYQLVLFSRRQQLAQRQRRGMGASDAAADLPAQLRQLERLSAVLQPALDWQAVRQLACGNAASSDLPAARAQRGRRVPATAATKAAAAAAAAAGAASPAAALAVLEQQAAQQLQAWQAALPAATAACSISALPGSQGGSILISRLAPAGPPGEPPLPPLLVALPVQQLSASLSQHPIRALRMDDDAADDACRAVVSSVQSVLDEMAAVLADSGRSMRELSTETKEQQREWWRARLALDDRLAALTKHLDSSWLGPWRCLLLGAPTGSSGSQAGEAAAQHLLGLLAEAGQPASQQQAGVLRHAAALLAQHAGGMSQGELRQAAHQLSAAAGLACSQEQQHQLEALLREPPAAGGDAVAEAEAAEAADPAPSKARKGSKSVKFADDGDAGETEQQQQQQQQQQPQQAEKEEPTAVPTASGSRAGRGRRPAAARGRRGAEAAAAAAEAQEAAESSARGGGDASPVATLAAVRTGANEPPPVAGGGLCQALDALSLEDAPAPGTAAAAPATGTRAGTTARTGRHRSRLRMLQAGTPGPGTARKAAAAAAAATAPRPARELPLTVAKTAPPPASRKGTADSSSTGAVAAAAGPMLLVLDGALQALPWESAPGLLGRRLYRMPSLACAAASAQRASTSVDLSSTFYALNPSGDLATTQATFQDWFRGMKGWEGKAGCAPTAAELAAALQHHAFFLYCGHGGGEQYISVTKLRSLERCSAALLMGCSSGRLRVQQHYEPAGAVLAYLLAGCPAAVANLWDVTDRDIDRFSQALLTAYISSSGGSSRSSKQSNGDSGDENSEPLGTDMSAAVGASRGVCKLPHLVGAAPVCYGLPSRAFLG
ncbi:hypothetical protein ABPG75_000396 [Micractinium tetrahymenae]